jgi:hypothetical protein
MEPADFKRLARPDLGLSGHMISANINRWLDI